MGTSRSSSRRASPTSQPEAPLEMNVVVMEGLVREMRDQRQEMAALRAFLKHASIPTRADSRTTGVAHWDDLLPATREQRKVRIQAAEESEDSEEEEE